MANLPTDFTAETLKGKRFRYTNAVELLADLRRIRRRLGWYVYFDGADPERKRYQFRFSIHEDVEDPDCVFEILFAAILQNLWPSLHPDNPEVPRLRRLLVDDLRRGGHGLAAWVNETAPETPGPAETDGGTALDQLLDDDE